MYGHERSGRRQDPGRLPCRASQEELLATKRHGIACHGRHPQVLSSCCSCPPPTVWICRGWCLVICDADNPINSACAVCSDIRTSVPCSAACCQMNSSSESCECCERRRSPLGACLHACSFLYLGRSESHTAVLRKPDHSARHTALTGVAVLHSTVRSSARSRRTSSGNATRRRARGRWRPRSPRSVSPLWAMPLP